MSYHQGHRKFNRKRNQRNALMRSLALSLLNRGKIKTTEAKARELRPAVEKLITKGKNNSVPVQRLLLKRIKNKSAVHKVLHEWSPKYASRAGGYTRIVKLGTRKSDGSRMAIIEFV